MIPCFGAVRSQNGAVRPRESKPRAEVQRVARRAFALGCGLWSCADGRGDVSSSRESPKGGALFFLLAPLFLWVERGT